jgi:hypothetical protein
MAGRALPRSFALGGLVWSAQAANDERRTTDHEQDAGGACDETLELVVGVDLAPNNTSMHEGSRDQSCPRTPSLDQPTWAHQTSHTKYGRTRTEKDESDIHDGIIGHCVRRGEGIRARRACILDRTNQGTPGRRGASTTGSGACHTASALF